MDVLDISVGKRPPSVTSRPTSAPSPVAAVEAVLSLPDTQVDYARAKLALDGIIDPSLDTERVLAELDELTRAARVLARPSAADPAKLAALRKLIYEGGPWNGYRPFAYDHDGFRDLGGKLIANYLETRLGNCVSMPILFLILADRLGLEIGLALAPNHVTLRYTDRSGLTTNLEATGTALPARTAWYREIMPISDRSLESGLYLRTLSRGEGVALMATIVVEYLQTQRRYEEAIGVCELILRKNPRCGHTLANFGSACSKMARRDFLDRYGSLYLVPPHLRRELSALLEQRRRAYTAAESLGWERVAPMQATQA